MATPMDRCLSTVLVPPTQSCLWDTRMCESHDPGWWLEAFSNTGLRSSLTGETSANPNLAAETNLWCESSSLLPHLLGAVLDLHITTRDVFCYVSFPPMVFLRLAPFCAQVTGVAASCTVSTPCPAVSKS